ncbi:hypothetical protein QUF84_07855 [Fictibacillus enclensis]|nr:MULTISPECIES: hypothetical protein [Fictibacillus]MDM5197984.1 hypothetical protein [Fictibacillus enclensis]MDM5337127.1 hypothetical protein [Fictibacillus enclensis]WHY73558.1 hypothetical protein QNH15_06510 [Fictibacillus enclensis]SCB77002.1 hypothetical protein GA0061096_0378 [Fictibacillus enclensis]
MKKAKILLGTFLVLTALIGAVASNGSLEAEHGVIRDTPTHL